ncbi:hypothetical protein ElyMa_000879800 [Elysia marginata]|uniref:Uncharacterized protein n=1 Tax=Elysia marginata TaxID=1093978 RepID=A0AAV4H4V4_9GAST|nr:hypothetical protein ElyMa_000879800 [Elysia marginata]
MLVLECLTGSRAVWMTIFCPVRQWKDALSVTTATAVAVQCYSGLAAALALAAGVVSGGRGGRAMAVDAVPILTFSSVSRDRLLETVVFRGM